MNFENVKKKSANLKSQDLCQMFVISKKKTIPWGMALKIYRKSIAQSINFYSLRFPSLGCLLEINKNKQCKSRDQGQGTVDTDLGREKPLKIRLKPFD